MSNRWFPSGIICASLFSLMLSGSHENLDADEVLTIQQIVDACRERSESLGRGEISWRHAPHEGPSRMSLFEGHWVSEEIEVPPRILRWDAATFEFQSRRWLEIDHTPKDESVAATLSVAKQRGKRRPQGDFHAQLYDYFRNPEAEFLAPQPFQRRFNGDHYFDISAATDNQANRIRIHSAPKYGTADWALLSDEVDFSQAVDTLDAWAALLSIQSLSFPPMMIDPEVARPVQTIRTSESEYQLRIDEVAPESPQTRRTFWVDPERDFALVRYRGQTKQNNAQIDIEYAQREDRYLPVSWTVSLGGEAHEPVLSFVSSMVEQVDLTPDTPLKIDEVTFAEIPPGSWVVDDHIKSQYLILPDGNRREITSRELQFFPNYQELVTTGTGEFADKLAFQIWLREFLLTKGIFIALAGVLFTAAIIVKYRKGVTQKQLSIADSGASVESASATE